MLCENADVRDTIGLKARQYAKCEYSSAVNIERLLKVVEGYRKEENINV